MITFCGNCGSQHTCDACPYCEHAHYELLERLNGREDGTASLMTVASWAMFGFNRQNNLSEKGNTNGRSRGKYL